MIKGKDLLKMRQSVHEMFGTKCLNLTVDGGEQRLDLSFCIPSSQRVYLRMSGMYFDVRVYYCTMKSTALIQQHNNNYNTQTMAHCLSRPPYGICHLHIIQRWNLLIYIPISLTDHFSSEFWCDEYVWQHQWRSLTDEIIVYNYIWRQTPSAAVSQSGAFVSRKVRKNRFPLCWLETNATCEVNSLIRRRIASVWKMVRDLPK